MIYLCCSCGTCWRVHVCMYVCWCVPAVDGGGLVWFSWSALFELFVGWGEVSEGREQGWKVKQEFASAAGWSGCCWLVTLLDEIRRDRLSDLRVSCSLSLCCSLTLCQTQKWNWNWSGAESAFRIVHCKRHDCATLETFNEVRAQVSQGVCVCVCVWGWGVRNEW